MAAVWVMVSGRRIPRPLQLYHHRRETSRRSRPSTLIAASAHCIRKRDGMGKLFTKGMMMIAGTAGLILGSSSAALADDVLVAKVPFNFVVNGVQLPAGD